MLLTIIAVVAGTALAGTDGRGTRYDNLVHAGTRMLVPLTPYALVVVISLAAYWMLPMRESTFVILVGLGPFTLIRPAVVLAGAALALTGTTDTLIWVVTILAAAGVLTVEPWVHHRWYQNPQ
ncbi:MAG: hypothetical protein JWN00_381 [Actinomycetia bacterium]|nr:hypothetical protein [Actinomycetes bacterium]